MTSLPASRMRLGTGPRAARDGRRSRGLRPRHDQGRPPSRIPPLQRGLPYVAVNGQLVVDGGRITAARPGRPLYGPGYKGVR